MHLLRDKKTDKVRHTETREHMEGIALLPCRSPDLGSVLKLVYGLDTVVSEGLEFLLEVY